MKNLLISLFLVVCFMGCYEDEGNNPNSNQSGIYSDTNETEYSITDLRVKELEIEIFALEYSGKAYHNIYNAYTEDRIKTVYVRCEAGWSISGGEYSQNNLTGSHLVERVSWKDDTISIFRANYSGTSRFKIFILYK